ncbi:hypothetical protein UJ101_00551 [Flavobacteriaceae bacterium UJ101]|nr:hypothetical protein UJ101_00551 [Flavobacteriaceae bacterium UJ101]
MNTNHSMKENSTSNNDTHNQSSDEIDLRELFRLIREGVINIWEWFLSLLVILFRFFRKNIVFLLLGSLLGLGLGIASYSTFSSQKVYKMVVSPNSISRMFLYDKIKYYNENKKDEDYTIIINPVKDYKESTEILLNKLGVDNKDVLEKIKIEDYIASIKDFEYNEHIISIYSDKEIDTKKVQSQIIAAVENSSLIIKRQKEELEILNAEKKRIEDNLNNINKTIQKDLESTNNTPSGSILVENTSEADVFNAYQSLSNELSAVERKIDRQTETLQVLSDLSFTGETRFSDDLSHLKPEKSSLVWTFVQFILIGFGIVLILITGLYILRYFIKKSV